MTRDELLAVIAKARREEATSLALIGKGIAVLPPKIGQPITGTIPCFGLAIYLPTY